MIVDQLSKFRIIRMAWHVYNCICSFRLFY